MRTEGELRALVSLLADEQEGVARVAWDALLQSGPAAVPYLEEAFDAAGALQRGRARLLLDEVLAAEAEEPWRRFATADGVLDLERGCLLLARVTGAKVQERVVTGVLDAMAGTVQANLAAGGLEALELVLFDNMGFRGGEPSNPDHHLLPSVLKGRRGLPITLAAVYIIVGQRVGLPVYGVAMPDHFLALYEQADQRIYIDCFNRGHRYRQPDLLHLLRRRGIAAPDQVLAPCSNRFMLFRMLNNLERLYAEQSNHRMAQRVQRWRDHLGIRR